MLSSAGIEHAYHHAKKLSSYSVELVISSLYLRTQHTAEILNSTWQAKTLACMGINEYFLREDGSGVETVEQAFYRASQAIIPYSLIYETIAIVSHNSLLSTYMTGFLNLPYEQGKHLFSKLGTVHVLSYDWQVGEQNWSIKETIEGK